MPDRTVGTSTTDRVGERAGLPTGTVTFLFTDVEGSTRLLHELGAEAYGRALDKHRRILRSAFARHGGVEVDTQGDAFFAAFPTAQGAIDAATDAQAELADGPVRVRMGVHTGTPHLGAEGYLGTDVHRAARIAGAGHGGQVLVSAATAGLVAPTGLRDLGEHRLKDLSAPERIYQIGSGEFPPLKTLHQTNLPVPATAFLGREQEIEDIVGLLGRDDVRLVTLTGPGGTGKTRLALQAAASATEAFEAGVWWVALAAIRDADLVVPTVARVLGAQGDVAEHIGDQRMLLLVDNFEQVTRAATAIGALLERCPNLVVLVTSREPLHLAGEWEYSVDPLRESEAVALFETRALAARRDFHANGEIREICLRLDYLPLAIELAAARAKILSPRALLERLDQRLPILAGGARDLPERQRTLRATIEWSNDLLSADEQRLFARLAAFRGGWTLESAESVADADIDTLQSLVEKSLVRQRDDRFWMLETIREYAADRLEASGEGDAIRRRHAVHFLALAEGAHRQIARDTGTWLPRLETEHDNFRAALDRTEASGDGLLLARLAGALWPFWYLADHALEATRRLTRALTAYTAPDEVRARALSGAAAMASALGDISAERRYVEEALAIRQARDDPWALAHSQMMFGQLLAGEGNWAAARDVLSESVEAFDGLGDDHFAMIATRTLAWMHEELGDVGRYRELTEQNYRRARATGNKRMEARAQASLAGFEVDGGRVAQGLAMYQSSLRLDRETGDTNGARLDLCNIANVLSMTPQPETATRVLAAAEAWRERTSSALESWNKAMNDETLERIHARLSDDEFSRAWERGSALTVDEVVELALAATV